MLILQLFVRYFESNSLQHGCFSQVMLLFWYMRVWLKQLHTGAQWYNIPEEKQTPLQRVAARTQGLVTLGNAVTLLGGGLTLLGLFWAFYIPGYAGLIAIGCGRLLDILDGYLARRTKTSSPFGEGLDAAVDKLTAVTALTLFLIHGNGQFVVIFLLLLIEEMATAVLILWSRRHGIVLHPSRLGKYTTFALWTAIMCLFLGFAAAVDTQFMSFFYILLGLFIAGVAVILRWWAFGQYLRAARKARRTKE